MPIRQLQWAQCKEMTFVDTSITLQLRKISYIKCKLGLTNEDGYVALIFPHGQRY